MSRTRSDFLTRCNSEGATQSDDDDEYYVAAHSHTLPPSLSPLCAHPEADCHSDSEMVTCRISRGSMTSKQTLPLPLRPPPPLPPPQGALPQWGSPLTRLTRPSLLCCPAADSITGSVMAEANGDARRSAVHTATPPLSLLHLSLLYFTTRRFTLIHNKQADFGFVQVWSRSSGKRIPNFQSFSPWSRSSHPDFWFAAGGPLC